MCNAVYWDVGLITVYFPVSVRTLVDECFLLFAITSQLTSVACNVSTMSSQICFPHFFGIHCTAALIAEFGGHSYFTMRFIRWVFK